MARGFKTGGRRRGTPNRVTATTREHIWAEIERRAEAGQQANPLVIALDLMVHSPADRVKLSAAEFLGDRLLPKLRAVSHSGSIEQEVRIIQHRYGRSVEPRDASNVTPLPAA